MSALPSLVIHVGHVGRRSPDSRLGSRSISVIQHSLHVKLCAHEFTRLTVDVRLLSRAKLTDMACSHYAAALGTAILALFVTFQLISHFGLPALDLLHLANDAYPLRSVSNQHPVNSPYDEEEEVTNDGTVYKLGVGKADITGYGS